MNPDILVICGPTAAGKTNAALELIDFIGGPAAAEIINADSMQVYAGMDIGTAKILPAQMRGITHHLLDVWPVTQQVTVADYQTRARACVADIRERGKLPVLVGGSGLYITAVIDDLQFPGTDPQVRARLEQYAQEQGSEALHRRLQSVDPTAAERILPGNARRIVRALEVIELTGEPFSAALPQRAGERPVYPAAQWAVDWPSAQLGERIAQRVELMWESGFVAEVQQLVARGLERSRTARQALGYAQVLAYLRGNISEVQAREQTISATRRFARRQRSWLRRDHRVRWVDASGGVPIDKIAQSLSAS